MNHEAVGITNVGDNGVTHYKVHNTPINLGIKDMTPEKIKDYNDRGWHVVLYRNVAVIF